MRSLLRVFLSPISPGNLGGYHVNMVIKGFGAGLIPDLIDHQGQHETDLHVLNDYTTFWK